MLLQGPAGLRSNQGVPKEKKGAGKGMRNVLLDVVFRKEVEFFLSRFKIPCKESHP